MDKPSYRQIRKRVVEALRSGAFSLEALADLPAQSTAAALGAALPVLEGAARRRAIEAMGAVVARLADQDLEAARNVVRKLVWSLNEESGGCPWGAPEAIGEICARHPRLAEEFGSLLVNFIDPDAQYLEHPPLLQGAAWAIGRVAQVRPDRVAHALPHLTALLQSPDAGVRAAAAQALDALRQAKEA
ncbi:MAG: HEAT repeat domain-containing protein [Candidatus Sumerlaeota bacterium]|nr:HEAT repeat domain-containing protein [Candidatus Sumerlaeota bacterium]